MVLFEVLFQSQILNMTPPHCKDKKGLYIPKWGFCASQMVKFNAVLADHRQHSGMNWKFFVERCTDIVMSSNVFGFWQQLHLQNIKQWHFTQLYLRLDVCSLFFHLHKDSIHWKMSGILNWIWPCSPSSTNLFTRLTFEYSMNFLDTLRNIQQVLCGSFKIFEKS